MERGRISGALGSIDSFPLSLFFLLSLLFFRSRGDFVGITSKFSIRVVVGLVFVKFYCRAVALANWVAGHYRHLGGKIIPMYQVPLLVPALHFFILLELVAQELWDTTVVVVKQKVKS